MEDLTNANILGWREEVAASPPIKGVPGRSLDPEATTYVDIPRVGGSSATEDSSQAVVAEAVEALRGGVEEDPFRSSSKVMRSPPTAGPATVKEEDPRALPVPRRDPPCALKVDSLPDMGLLPVVGLERMGATRTPD